jgi:hypothetical protein
MNRLIKESLSAWDSSSKPPVHSPIFTPRQMHEKLSDNAVDLDPIARTPLPFSPPPFRFQIYANIRFQEFTQIYHTQNHDATCPPLALCEVPQELIHQAAPIPNEKRGIRPLALNTDDGFCNYFEQVSMITSGTITQASVRSASILCNTDIYKNCYGIFSILESWNITASNFPTTISSFAP